MLNGGTMNIQERSFEFACRIVRLTEYLARRSFVVRTLARQLLRSGTSVGANLEEANAAQSKPGFISKCSIAAKEARETRYWLRLLTASRSISSKRLEPLINEANEIVAILTTIVKTAAKSPRRHSTLNIQH
jgi:four helix bundle protein